MRWPWHRASGTDRWVMHWSDKVLTYVRARALPSGQWDVHQLGQEVQGMDDEKAFTERLARLGLRGATVHAMLGHDQYQFLQVEAPAVPPDELRAATRYLIRDMIDTHVDDVTLDILKVGDGEGKAAGQLFVVVAKNAVVREIMNLAAAMQWDVPVIDIQKLAQRNVQNALAALEGQQASAMAALFVGTRQATLTICANDELFYTRSVDLPPGFADIDWTAAQTAQAIDGYMPVGEYVPDYAVASYGSTSGSSVLSGPSASDQADGEKAQRFLVEIQRSLDLWDRNWATMPLAGVSVYADDQSVSLAQWLTRELGQPVEPLALARLFPAWAKAAAPVQQACAPLLGVLLRLDSPKT